MDRYIDTLDRLIRYWEHLAKVLELRGGPQDLAKAEVIRHCMSDLKLYLTGNFDAVEE